MKICLINLQLASIPGLEDVTVDGVRSSTETNGPAAAGSHATGPSLGPPVEVIAITNLSH